jgi:hypothetical protein
MSTGATSDACTGTSIAMGWYVKVKCSSEEFRVMFHQNEHTQLNLLGHTLELAIGTSSPWDYM